MQGNNNFIRAVIDTARIDELIKKILSIIDIEEGTRQMCASIPFIPKFTQMNVYVLGM